MRGAAKRHLYRRQENVAQAWYVNYLARHKTLPDFAKLISGIGEKRKQTPEEMLAIAKQMSLFAGGGKTLNWEKKP